MCFFSCKWLETGRGRDSNDPTKFIIIQKCPSCLKERAWRGHNSSEYTSYYSQILDTTYAKALIKQAGGTYLL